ncbi:hypothetical protein CSV61_05915 [Sporosarcina sp. P3]|uniref:hypothetical protein n=1 Tax=Sporosarcina sp. P3 TaxID=2048245 RepID=UPI000C1627E7|nr:hypothetical protein [Sporosarcina sp. P3]PID22384.1 hypothetical protein CSV61_05915 [Sporosarcina sp. P3]
MSTDLQQLFFRASDLTKQVLKEAEPYDHPLLTLLQKELNVQQEMLSVILKVFKQQDGEPSFDSFKQECSVVYHANEVATSFSASWIRAVEWMELPSKAIASEVEPKMGQIKALLSTAAEKIQEIYGEEAVKYVIPTFYLPA